MQLFRKRRRLPRLWNCLGPFSRTLRRVCMSRRRMYARWACKLTFDKKYPKEARVCFFLSGSLLTSFHSTAEVESREANLPVGLSQVRMRVA